VLYVDREPGGSGCAISTHPGKGEIMLPYGTKFMVTMIHPKGHKFEDETDSWSTNCGDEIVVNVTALSNI